MCGLATEANVYEHNVKSWTKIATMLKENRWLNPIVACHIASQELSVLIHIHWWKACISYINKHLSVIID